MTALPERREGETLAQFQTRMEESADHWWRCLAPTTKGGLCSRQRSSCPDHAGSPARPRL